MKNKKGLSGLCWILIILALIAVGVGIYFLLFKESCVGIECGSQLASSIPQPPTLPS